MIAPLTGVFGHVRLGWRGILDREYVNEAL
jgi:hypothetical protein